MKKYIYKGMAMLALLAATASCEKDTLPTNLAPSVVTGSTEGIYRTGVMSIAGRIDNPNGYTVEEYGIQYSLYQSFAEPKNIVATSKDVRPTLETVVSVSNCGALVVIVVKGRASP